MKLQEPLFREALDIAGKASGKQHPNYATSLYNFAASYLTIGDYEAAEPLLRDALEILAVTLGIQHPYTLTLCTASCAC